MHLFSLYYVIRFFARLRTSGKGKGKGIAKQTGKGKGS
jgi:hypothetical protein